MTTPARELQEATRVLRDLRRAVDEARGIGTTAAVRGNMRIAGNRIIQLRKPNHNDDALPKRFASDSFAPRTGSYVVLSSESELSDERVLVAGDNVTVVDGGANGNVVINAAAGISAEAVQGEIPSGTKNGSNKTFTLAFTPTTPDEVGLYLTGQRLERVASSPNNSQFTLSTKTITLGLAPASADSLFADYLKAVSATKVIGEIPSGTKNGVNKSFTLANAPLSDAELGLYFAGTRLEKVAATPNAMQFTISGAALTLGLAPNSGDSLFADYLK